MSAVRMSGLPVFLIGAGPIILVAMSVLGAIVGFVTVRGLFVMIYAAATGALLIALGLAIRRGRPSLVPLAAVVTFANVVVMAWFGPVWALVLQIQMALVMLSGLRGWLWLRRHPA